MKRLNAENYKKTKTKQQVIRATIIWATLSNNLGPCIHVIVADVCDYIHHFKPAAFPDGNSEMGREHEKEC